MQETYIDIMIQSLAKKEKVLDRIMELDELQKTQLENPALEIEDFDRVVEDKATLIEQLEQLDSGFDKLYDRVKELLQNNKETYKDQIKTMQDSIRRITDKSMEIQAQEARNKDLMAQKFAGIKKKARTVRTNYKAANQYYKNMMQTGVVDPQFLDKQH